MIDHDEDYISRSFPVQEDMRLQTRTWRFERVGWSVLFIVMLMTLFGIFGSGPLSETQGRSANGALSVQYDRFERNGASNQLIVSAKADPQGKVQLAIEGALLQRFTIEGIQPEPSNTSSYRDGIKLELKADPDGWTTIYFALRPTGVGVAKTTLSSGDQRVDLSQFIYP